MQWGLFNPILIPASFKIMKMKMSANIIFNTWGLSSSSINFHLTLTSVKTMSVVSCKGHPPPTPHSPSPHLRETGSVASHGSVESPQSPPVTTPRAAWVEPSFQLPNNPTATSSRCRPAALVQHKAIQLSTRQSENNTLDVGAMHYKWRGQPGSNLGNDSVCRM